MSNWDYRMVFSNKNILMLILTFIVYWSAFSNNLLISKVGLVERNTSGGNPSDHFGYVVFDIQWDNSWRVDSEPNNWDAVWVFVKYKVNSGPWIHATLHITGHAAPAGATVAASPDGKGAFIYRSIDNKGAGNVNFTRAKLRWNYGIDGVADNARVVVKVFGIEMVYVATDEFWVGSGGTEWESFTDGEWTEGNITPFRIASENAITINHSPGNLWAYFNSSMEDLGTPGTIPANYPKGYNHFYCMKYSISQGQYVDFLNCLTYSQQASRTAVLPSSPIGTLAMTTLQADRSGVKIKIPGNPSAIPALYGCDLNSNGVFNEADDGQHISCNWLSWADGSAYSDWAALRPMSELEFEKACRGPLDVSQYERPYGTDVVAHSVNITNAGTASEGYVPAQLYWNSVINGASNINAGGIQWGLLDYPIRVGVFANDTSNRNSSGATYYGIMDMAGDLWERAVTIGNAEGRSFVGTHGDGALDNDGNNTGNSDWPGIDAVGSGFRGGAFNYDSDWARTSDRDLASSAIATRYYDRSFNYPSNDTIVDLGFRGNFGFRSVRTAP